MKKRLIRQALKTLFSLTALTIVCGFLVRTLTNSETLSDYAAQNPKLAYGDTDEDTDVENEVETGAETITTEPYNLDNDSEVKNNDENNAAFSDEVQNIDIPTDSTETISLDRITYQEGFYYEPLSDDIKATITGISYPVAESEASSLAISYDNLRYLSVLYYDFSGNVQKGELICNKGIVEDLVEIFYELYLDRYQIEKIRLVEEYQGDDEASMKDNNTYCFNYRKISGTDTLSNHALGCAIDINPFYNPYVVENQAGETTTVSPAGSGAYASRSMYFSHKIDKDDLCYKLFKEHGFEWGGDWKRIKDYQHFEKNE